MSERRVALVVTAVGGIAFVVLALVLVPWHPVPGGTPSAAPAETVFTTAQIDRAEDYAHWARIWSWSSLGVSLVVACVLGFGPWGRRIVDRLPGWWWVRVVLAVAAPGRTQDADATAADRIVRTLSSDDGAPAPSTTGRAGAPTAPAALPRVSPSAPPATGR